MHTQVATEAIDLNSDLAEDLREPTCSNPTVQFHLPEPFLGMYITLSKIEIIFVLCINMGYAIVIDKYFNRFV
jgi:hypothetical protein